MQFESEKCQVEVAVRDISLVSDRSNDRLSRLSGISTIGLLQDCPQKVVIDTVVQVEDVPTSPALRAKDSGRAAYTILLAALTIESAVFGMPIAYGVFQEYYTHRFVDHGIAAWIGVLSSTLAFLGAPLVTWSCQKYPIPREIYIVVGFILCVLSLLASAFIEVLPGLVVTQGLLYGIGVLLIDIPVLIITNTWFEKRRGIAYGIIFAGTDLTGVAYTFLGHKLLTTLTFRNTMLVLTGMTVAIGTPTLFFLSERAIESSPGKITPNSDKRRRSSTRSNLSLKEAVKVSPEDVPFSPSIEHPTVWPSHQPRKRYYQRSVFFIFGAANLFHACSFYLPLIYLPTYATELGLSKQQGALILAIANLAQVVGDLTFGKLSDKIHVNYLVMFSSGTIGVVTYVMWGLYGGGENSLAVLIAFAFIFGMFGAGMTSVWARMGTVFGERDAQMVYSTLCTGRGFGAIVSGPISQALISRGTPRWLRRLGYGPYGGLVMYVGACNVASALMGVLAVFALHFKKEDAECIERAEGEGEK